jgi:hypothetical protein
MGVNPMTQTSIFNNAMETIEALPAEDQQALIDLLQKRLVDNRRSEIAENITQSKAEYDAGHVVRGSIDDIINELNH